MSAPGGEGTSLMFRNPNWLLKWLLASSAGGGPSGSPGDSSYLFRFTCSSSKCLWALLNAKYWDTSLSKRDKNVYLWSICFYWRKINRQNKRNEPGNFLQAWVVEPPASVGDLGWIPGPGRSYMPWLTRQLSLSATTSDPELGEPASCSCWVSSLEPELHSKKPPQCEALQQKAATCRS